MACAVLVIAGVGVGVLLGHLGSFLDERPRDASSGADPAIAIPAAADPEAQPKDSGGEAPAGDESQVAVTVDAEPVDAGPRDAEPVDASSTGGAGNEASLDGAEAAVRSVVIDAMKDFPGLVPDPLGAYPARDEALRVQFRMFIDFLDRPPTRAELRNAADLTHEELWRSLRWRSATDLSVLLPSDIFRKFLDREPTSDEAEFVSQAPYEAIEQLSLWLTATRQYRSSAYRRDRDLRQLAKSLIVDFHDAIPSVVDHLNALEDAVLALPDLADVTRVLVASAPAQAAPEGEITERDVADEVFRFLQRLPDETELARLTQEVREHPARLHWLRMTLAREELYWRY